MTALLPTAGNTGAVFAISPADWQAIDTQVAVVIGDQAIGAEIAQYIPNYAALLGVCEAWQQTTLPALIAQADSTTLFAADAIQTLEQLEGTLAGLSPGDAVPSSTAFIVSVDYTSLQLTASGLQQSVQALSVPLAAFAQQNVIADGYIASMQSGLGPGWAGIGGQAGLVSQGLGEAVLSWGSISDLLGSIASGTLDVTTASLLSQDFTGAIASWTAVETAVTAFDGAVGTAGD